MAQYYGGVNKILMACIRNRFITH